MLAYRLLVVTGCRRCATSHRHRGWGCYRCRSSTSTTTTTATTCDLYLWTGVITGWSCCTLTATVFVTITTTLAATVVAAIIAVIITVGLGALAT